jgi:LDH2 family malate/lactate/ureidoglycolate dehydrogenase
MLIEILTGSLVRSLLSTQQASGWNPTEYGCLTLAIDIGSFCDLNEFKRLVAEMCQTLRSMHPANGFDGIAIPGDRGYANVKKARERGTLELEDKLLEDLRQLVE